MFVTAQSTTQTTHNKTNYARGSQQAVEIPITKETVPSVIKQDFTNSKIPSCSLIPMGSCEIPVNFSGLNVSIPDDDNIGVTNTQVVSGVPGSSLGVDIQLKRVCFNITHTWVGDLVVVLTAPNGVSIPLTDRPGYPNDPFGCDGNNLDVCVTGGTGNPMESQCNNNPAISGIWTAVDPDDLNKINVVGGSPNGTWDLKVYDLSLGDTGTVVSWSLIFDNGPSAMWSSPGEYCQTSGILDLTTLVMGTTGGTWTGTGVSGTNFDPAGLSGSISITYVVTDLTSGCTDSLTNSITVVSPPTVSFTATIVPPTTTVNFVNTSTGTATYLWDFGDGSTSTDTNATHTYASNGIYNVILTASNGCGQFSSSQQLTVQGCADMVQDGGFEGGSSAWTASSTNFGSPLCTIALCGNGSGTGPFAGNFWAWFGGSNTTFEEGIMTQVVNIPANGTATLLFQLEQIACDSPNDFLKIAVDQDTVYVTDGASSLCGQFGYTPQSVNLNAYADGQNHILTFISKSYVTNGGASNFFVDNVELRFCQGSGFNELNQISFEVMPNPAADYTELRFANNFNGKTNIIITDISGRIVYQSKSLDVAGGASHKIDTQNFSSGLYLIKVSTPNANAVRKLMIR